MWVVEGIGAAVRGPVDRHLGLLAAARGDRAAAVTHFAAAERACVDAGATLLAAEVCRDAGRALGDGDRLAADRRYRALGLAAEQTGPDPVFRSDGEVWILGYEGRQVRLRDAKGLRDLATLLARPGRPVAALDLATAYTRRPATGDAPGGVEGDLGEALDATARRAYRQRLAELEEELADSTADPERAARQRAERDALVEQLTTAYGLGGRRRRPGSPTERARTAVTGRIRDAIRHIEAAHPPLGRHLRGAVHTGTFCVYEPEHPVRWQVTRRF
jgi:hypothetical protein